jgi:DNA-binding LacI/PurR family transcriptional regulator
MASLKFASVALLIEQRVRARPSELLPPIAALADEYRVAYRTVWKALQDLADKGVVVIRKGARTIPATAARPAGSRDQFIEIMRSRLVDGTWKSGEIVPKFAYLQAEFHVGQETITRAMRALADEGLLHKRGRHWVVGMSPSAKRSSEVSRMRVSLSNVVLLMCADFMDAGNYSIWARPFLASFCSELMKNGYRIEVVLHEEPDTETADTIAGIDNIKAYTDSLGSRYRGLIAFSPGSMTEHFQRCVALATGWKKPVIMYDLQGDKVTFTRSLFGGHVPFFRMFFDEAAAAALAVEVLFEHGHRIVGFPDMFTPRHHWVAQRIGLARKAAEACDPPVRILSPKQKEPFWTYVQDKPLTVPVYLFRRIAKSLSLPSLSAPGVQAKPSIRRRLLAATPSMASLLKEGVTAIIAGNDYIARDYYHWLKMAGIRIPRDISLISFDNQPEFLAYPMSTIDPGFERLGYLAAHIMIGDIPVKADSEGRIPGACTLVDRGSVGPARGGDKRSWSKIQ